MKRIIFAAMVFFASLGSMAQEVAQGKHLSAVFSYSVFYQEKVLVLDNWRKLQGYGFNGFSKMSDKMDKGHAAEFALLNERTKNGGEPLISFEELVNATKASFACITSLKENRWVNIDE